MSWREIGADQNLRMASMMLNQQGELNKLAEKLNRIRIMVEAHGACGTGECDLRLGLEQEFSDD